MGDFDNEDEEELEEISGDPQKISKRGLAAKVNSLLKELSGKDLLNKEKELINYFVKLVYDGPDMSNYTILDEIVTNLHYPPHTKDEREHYATLKVFNCIYRMALIENGSDDLTEKAVTQMRKVDKSFAKMSEKRLKKKVGHYVKIAKEIGKYLPQEQKQINYSALPEEQQKAVKKKILNLVNIVSGSYQSDDKVGLEVHLPQLASLVNKYRNIK